MPENEIDLEGIQDITPAEAPVAEPQAITGKEKAGVSLTWGIIWILVGFVVFFLLIFWWGEVQFLVGLNQLDNLQDLSPEALAEINKLAETLDSQRSSFRTFWFDTLQLILLNVLFPTLTALLGYVFGTSRNSGS